MRQVNRLAFLAFLAVAILMQPVARAADAEPDIPQILAQAAGDDLAIDASKQAIRRLAASGPEVIEQLTGMLVEAGKGDDANVRRVLHGLAVYVARPGAASQRRAFNQALCAQLKADRPTEVKCFLISQLQITGGNESVAALAECLANDELAELARQALVANRSPAAIKALCEALPKAKGAIRVGIIQALGFIRDTKSVPALIKEAKSGDKAIRMAAVEALGSIGDPRGEPVIAAALNKGSAFARRAALAAYLQLADRMAAQVHFSSVRSVVDSLVDQAVGMYARVLETTSDPAFRCAALTGLAETPGAKAVALLVPYVTDPNPNFRTTASESLAMMPDKDVSVAVERALRKAQSPDKIILLRALRGRQDPKAMALVAAAAKDPNPEVRVAAWDLQEEITASPEMESTLLEVARTGSDLVRPATFFTYLRLALAETSKDRAIEMLRTIISLDPQREVRDAAVQQLWKLGVDFDLAHEKGFVTQWWLCGPLPGSDLEKAWPPEESVDTAAPVRTEGGEFRWTYYHPLGISDDCVVNLRRLMKPDENVTAYLYALVTVPEAQDVVLKMGSDDAMKVWLNGQLVHTSPGGRKFFVDQDTVAAHLQAGVNKFLLKVNQGGGQWAACLRITDQAGQPRKFTQAGD